MDRHCIYFDLYFYSTKETAGQLYNYIAEWPRISKQWVYTNVFACTYFQRIAGALSKNFNHRSVRSLSEHSHLPCHKTFNSTNNFFLSPGNLLIDSPLPLTISTFIAPAIQSLSHLTHYLLSLCNIVQLMLPGHFFKPLSNRNTSNHKFFL